MFIFKNGAVLNPETEEQINEEKGFISATEISFTTVDDVIENIINKIKIFTEVENQKLISKYSAEFASKKEELSKTENEFNSSSNINIEELDKISQIKAKLKMASYETKMKRLTMDINELQKKEEEELRERDFELKKKISLYRESLLELVKTSELLIENNLKGEKIEIIKGNGINISTLPNIPLRNLAPISVELSLDKNYDKKIKVLTEDKYTLSRNLDMIRNKIEIIEGPWLEIKTYAEVYAEEYSIFEKLTNDIVEILMERKEYSDVTRRKNEEDGIYIERDESKKRLLDLDEMLNSLIKETIKERIIAQNIEIPGFLMESKYFN
ncbi:hypothetical protein [Fusobacterium perfoetens]|uniref:hypothetical protein n=1 Tax=Fusobacterium perfoetens TaxID=852 RepID=UPI0004843900|nr:hypothetical protein [Fusobacterium perfoetens]MCI6151819.1 hypothetical protein [Fusobacterium perfoetens]MDY3236820.1 hypothetical protein [Fusobacterium perfoetens]